MITDRFELITERVKLFHMIHDKKQNFTSEQVSFILGAIHAIDWVTSVSGQMPASEYLEERNASGRPRP